MSVSTVGRAVADQVPSRDELITRAAALVPMLRGNAARGEEQRRVADENIEGLQRSGLARMGTQKRFGGYELDLATQLDALVQIGRGCPSTGWIAAVWLAGRALATNLSEQAQAELFAENPDITMCTSQSGTGAVSVVDGGFVLNGKWGFCSGSGHARYAFLMAPVADEGGQPTGAAITYTPIDQLTKHDTWHVAGMVATGSNTYEAKDLFVPEYRGTIVTGMPPGDTTAMSLTLVAVVVGAAQAVLELTRTMFDSRRAITYTTAGDISQSAAAQVWLAEAAQLIDSAYRQMQYCAGVTQRWMDGEEFGNAESAPIRMTIGDSLEKARAGVNKLLDLNGASSFALKNPLQRFWRDVEVGSRHGQLNNYIAHEDFGRSLTGVGEKITLIE